MPRWVAAGRRRWRRRPDGVLLIRPRRAKRQPLRSHAAVAVVAATSGDEGTGSRRQPCARCYGASTLSHIRTWPRPRQAAVVALLVRAGVVDVALESYPSSVSCTVPPVSAGLAARAGFLGAHRAACVVGRQCTGCSSSSRRRSRTQTRSPTRLSVRGKPTVGAKRRRRGRARHRARDAIDIRAVICIRVRHLPAAQEPRNARLPSKAVGGCGGCGGGCGGGGGGEGPGGGRGGGGGGLR